MTAKERMQSRAARALAALPPRAQVRLSGRPPIVIDGQMLDPEVQLLLANRRWIGEPAWDDRLSPERGREITREALAIVQGTKRVPVGGVRDLTVEGAAGPLRARHYAPPEDTGPRPLLVYYHGGGFVACDLDTHDAPCRILCRHAGVHVLGVEYRLAPEDPFPGYVEDALSAFAWARAHARELGADRVLVGGDSAGGNLAAVVAQERRGEDGPAFQLLIYPTVDATQHSRSYALFGEGFILTHELMDWYAGHFLPAGSDATDLRRSPILADVAGVAPALVVTAGFDPLRDEGEAYAAKLAQAGVPVVARRFTGMIHTFIHCVGVSPSCRAATVEMAGMLRALLATHT